MKRAEERLFRSTMVWGGRSGAAAAVAAAGRGGSGSGSGSAGGGGSGSGGGGGGSNSGAGGGEPSLSSMSDLEGEVWSLCCDPTGTLAVAGGKAPPRVSSTTW